MTDDLAFLLGAYLSEGHTTRSNWSVILTNSVEEVLVRAQKAWLSTFGLHARLTQQHDRCPGLVVSSRRLVLFLDSLGCGSRARNKAVPELILQGTRRHALLFLQGAALDAYTTHAYAGKWAICLESQEAIDGLQSLVTRLGIVNAQIPKFSKQTTKTYYELYAPGAWGQDLSALAPFLEPEKAARAAAYRRVNYRTKHSDVIPGVHGPSLYRLLPAGTPGRSGRGSGRQRFRHLTDPRTARVTRASVIAVRDAGATLPIWLSTVLEQQIRFAPLIRVTPDGHQHRSSARNE
ncbi:LAGLIDADG family homing endonuclease [Nocardioides sp. 31GB23]|uniref:LAGLIDADG family homing endonuclease n=1 Tax=Nocardioides sp. 31GB23 TaxID=3156065 RepID=UPI0032AF29BC